MLLSNENRVAALKLRIAKLSAKPTVNEKLIKKAERQIRKLS